MSVGTECVVKPLCVYPVMESGTNNVSRFRAREENTLVRNKRGRGVMS